MSLKSSILLLFALLFPFQASAQSEDDTRETLGIGMAWAPIGGNGFSLRKLPSSGLGFQCGTIFWKSGNDSYFSIGGEILYILHRSHSTALYIPAGIGFAYSEETYWDYPPYPYGREVHRSSSDIAAGAGIGFTGRTWSEIWAFFDLILISTDNYFGPMGQVGIHYYFR